MKADADLARTRRVLVAEDDPQMRALVADALRKDGYDVEEVADGRSLLLCLMAGGKSRSSVDLVVSDVRMPIVNGLALVETLRSERWTIPVILMTAFGDDATRARANELGVLLFDKPFKLDDLRVAARKLL